MQGNQIKKNLIPFFSFSPARRLHPAFTLPSPARLHVGIARSPVRPFGHPFGVGVPRPPNVDPYSHPYEHVDPYSHPYEHVTQEDWRHLIDDVWKSKEHKVRSKAGKKNRKKLEYNHCSGFRSFVATMTIQPEFNGYENHEFPEFYKKTHTKKNKEWIDPICAVKHSKMLSLREESSQSGVQLTSEEMSRQAFGKRKRYILGFGDGPKPSSSSPTPSRVSQDHVGELQKLKAEMEEMKMEEMKMEREMEREELRRQLEQERREHEEEKKEQEEEQKQIAHLTSLVTEFLKEKTQTHKSSIHHDGAMYSTGGTNTR